MRKKLVKLGAFVGGIGSIVIYPIYMIFNIKGGYFLILLFPFSLYFMSFDNEPMSLKVVLVIIGLALANIVLFAMIGYLIGFICDIFAKKK